MLKLLIILLVLLTGVSYAQCDKSLIEECKPDIARYAILKAMKVQISKGKKRGVPQKIRQSYMFTKGNIYRIGGCVDEYTEQPMIFELYDKKGVIISSYNKTADKHYKAFEFKCQKTGVYYVIFYFLDGVKGCGAASIAYRKVEQ